MLSVNAIGREHRCGLCSSTAAGRAHVQTMCLLNWLKLSTKCWGPPKQLMGTLGCRS